MDASQCRQRVGALLEQLSQAVEVLMQHRCLLRGSVYTLKRRCGKAGCRCAEGHLHETPCLSTSVSGKTQIQVIQPQDMAKAREWSKNYQASRKALKKVDKLCGELLSVCRQLQQAQIVKMGRGKRAQEKAKP